MKDEKKEERKRREVERKRAKEEERKHRREANREAIQNKRERKEQRKDGGSRHEDRFVSKNILSLLKVTSMITFYWQKYIPKQVVIKRTFGNLVLHYLDINKFCKLSNH